MIGTGVGNTPLDFAANTMASIMGGGEPLSTNDENAPNGNTMDADDPDDEDSGLLPMIDIICYRQNPTSKGHSAIVILPQLVDHHQRVDLSDDMTQLIYTVSPVNQAPDHFIKSANHSGIL